MIRLSTADDYPAICAYLETHWRKRHIFCSSRALFDWQHFDPVSNAYNFVIGCDDTGRILGVLGFVPTGQFDSALERRAIFLCIWSVSEEARGTGLGSRLLAFVEAMRPQLIATVGASEMTLAMYRKRGWKTGRMEHWYSMRDTAFIGRGGFVRGPSTLPTKTSKYVENRYSKHPWYQYQIYSNGPTSVVLRVAEAPERRVRVLRVVDIIGPSAGLSHLPWRQLAERYDCKTVDLYCAGIPSRDLEAAGFKRRRGDEVIIPNHFEPYEHRNVEIDYAIKAPAGVPWRLCRGDGDQDRPNVIA